MIQPDFNSVFLFGILFVFFFGGEEGGGVGREVFVVTNAFKSFILKLDMGNSIFLNIFVQD